MISQHLSQQDLRMIVSAPPRRKENIGIEVELSLVSPLSGMSLPYEGLTSVRSLFEILCSDGLGEPVFKHGHLSGVQLREGGRITFENGGAIEYCSPPLATLSDLS